MSTSESDIVARISALNAEPANEAPAEQPREQQPEREVSAGPAEDAGDSLPESEGSSEARTDGEASETAVEEIEIGDLNDLAKHLGVDPAELYDIAVPYTKDGVKQEFTLGQLKDDFQKYQEAETLRAEAQARLDAYRQAEEQANELLQAHAVQANAIAQAMENQLLADFSGVDWARLQASNPSEYIRLSQQFNQRQSQLQNMRQQAFEFAQQQGTQLQAQREQLQQQRLLREQQALLKAIPEWRDPAIADAERQELAKYMLARGYNEAEINAVDDHRALLLVRDAMKYRQMKESGDIAAKKVVKLAKKIVKPGSRQTASETSSDSERGLKRTLKQTGSVQDAASLISLRLGRKK